MANGKTSFWNVAGGVLPGLLGGIAGIFGASADRRAQERANRQQRQFALDMYNRQRKDALDFWNMQNAYNTPEAQMQRFKDAGLNPNLIYGRGSEGNAGSINVPSQGHFNPKAPEYGNSLAQAGLGLGSSIARYVDLKAKNAQINNLGAQNDLLKQQAARTAAETANTVVRTARSRFDLGLASDLRRTSMDAAKANLRNVEASTEVLLQRNEREAASNAVSIQDALQRIAASKLNMQHTRADIRRIEDLRRSIQQDVELKRLDANLKRMGIQPGDAAWMRILSQIWANYKGNVKQAIESGNRAARKFLLNPGSFLP